MVRNLVLLIFIGRVIVLEGAWDYKQSRPSDAELEAERREPYSPSEFLWNTPFWPDGLVPIAFDPSLRVSRVIAINIAIDTLISLISPNDERCVRFPVIITGKNPVSLTGNHLYFTEDDIDNCSSTQRMGRTGGRQVINVGDRCLPTNGWNAANNLSLVTKKGFIETLGGGSSDEQRTAGLITGGNPGDMHPVRMNYDININGLMNILIKAMGGSTVEQLKYIYHCGPGNKTSSNRCPNDWIRHPKGVCYKQVSRPFLEENSDEHTYLSARNHCAKLGGHIMHIPPYPPTTDVFIQMMSYNNTQRYTQWRLGIRGVGRKALGDVVRDNNNNLIHLNDYNSVNFISNPEGFLDRDPFYWDYGDAQAPVKIRDESFIGEFIRTIKGETVANYLGDGFSLYFSNDEIIGEYRFSISGCNMNADLVSTGVYDLINNYAPQNPIPYYCEKSPDKE
jgi:hypothetical protein